MEERSVETADLECSVERARRAVSGFLVPTVLHETNNVLTVMAGVRQILKSGQSLSDRVGAMIDQQLARMEQLVESIRRIGPEEQESATRPRTIESVVESIEQVVQIAGKARGLVTERTVRSPDAIPDAAGALALAVLCVVLPALPRGGASGARLSLEGGSGNGDVAIAFVLNGAARDPGGEPEAGIARTLLRTIGGSVEWRMTGSILNGRARVPLRGKESGRA